MSYKNQLNKIAERLDYLENKVNSGRHTYAEKQERDVLLQKYLELDMFWSKSLLAKADKIQALVSQMARHENLNKEDMPFVCEILNGELESVVNKLKTGG